jgi:tRNA threonylcarbamoyladenosine biosynthesis protein TsaE
LELLCKSIDDNIVVSEQILEHYPDARIFALYGKMGAGKTTFIKSFCKVLGAEKTAKSPTFAIINEYECRDIACNVSTLYHFDFYRIKNEDEAYDIGYEEYFYSGNYCFIEWPERIENLLPERYVRIDIKVNNDETRLITASS